MSIRNFLCLLIIAIAISACSQMDMQGVDPKDFYAEHPVKNDVETRHALFTLNFDDMHEITEDSSKEFQDMMQDVSPAAIESVKIRLAPSQMTNGNRQQNIAKLLRSMDYDTSALKFESSKETSAADAELDVSYAIVVPPHCPDWRTSPVTTNSNMPQANFACATTVNLGAMVADPRDLKKGSGKSSVDTQTAVKALQDYKNGVLPTSNSSGSTTSVTPSNGASSQGQ